MVTESNCLSVGTLFIVTCTGATIGREKDMNHAIRIPDISVSKVITIRAVSCEKLSLGFPTMTNTNRALQPQNMVRDLKFKILTEGIVLLM